MRSTICLLSILLVVPILAAESTDAPADPPEGWPPGWYARIETSMGNIVVLLLADQSPESVAHFVAFARGEVEWTDPVAGEPHQDRFYDGAEVYNARAGSMFQVGNRSGSGSFAPFIYVPEKGSQLVNFNLAWRLGNVRVGPRVSASRFLITAASEPALNYTVPCFGVVMEGKDVVFAITTVKTNKGGRPLEPIVIRTIDVYPLGKTEPLPERTPYFPEPAAIELRKIELRED